METTAPPPASTCVDEDQGGLEVPCPEISETVESQGPAEPQTVESSTIGKNVYVLRCVGCHGIDGSGVVGPDIRPGEVLEKYASAESMEALVREGLGEMPEFGSKLSVAEIAAVVAYVRGGLG
ncbi:MAG: cytochrome c [bacterium]|nr:cytochrome c [bacterium]